MPEWVKPTQVNAKCDVVIKLSVFGTWTDTHTTRQNLYILTTWAVIKLKVAKEVVAKKNRNIDRYYLPNVISGTEATIKPILKVKPTTLMIFLVDRKIKQLVLLISFHIQFCFYRLFVFTAQRYANAVCAVVMCLSVCVLVTC